MWAKISLTDHPRRALHRAAPNASQDSTVVVFNALGHKQVCRCEQLLLLKQQCAGGLPVNLLKANFVARAKLSEAMQVGGNHVGNLRIAAGGLLLYKQDDGQAASGN